MRPLLENLEDRLAPSVTTINVNDKSDTLDNPTTVTAATLGGKVTLLDAIHAANNSGSSGGNSYVINLQANTTYDLTSINNYWYGPNGLPSIFSNITINGNGATIQRDSSAANFRLFYVSGGIDGPPPGSLTLENLTLQGGVAQGGESDLGGSGLGAGGAIFSQGTLTLTGVTLTNNEALGGTSTPSVRGYGGGGMGGNGNLASAGGFGGALDLPAGYAGGVGGNGGSGNAGGGGGGGGGFGPSDTGSSGSGSAGGVGGGQGGFGGSGGGFTGTYLGDGGGGSFGVGGSGGTGGAFGIGGNASLGITAGGGGGGVGGGGSSDGNSGFDADGGAGGFGGGGGIGFGGGNGGFGGGGGGFVAGTPGRGGFGGGNGSAFRSTSTPTGGGGAGMGGGIFSMMGTLSLTNCTLTANSAVGGNGANGGSGFGGAIFNLDSNLNITFCTIAANTVQGGTGLATGGAADGGAVYNLAYGNNVATGAAQSSTATILDSILSNSSGGNDLVNNIVNGANLNTAAVALTGPNLVMASTGIGISGTAPLTADPQLGPLQNNGGLTPTMAITSSSPAYRVGSTVPGVPTDQRGANRHIPPSLGSFEPVPGTVITASNVTAFYSESAHSVTLTADVTSVAGPVNEGTVTFSVLKGGVVIGTATTSGTVVDGFASVNYTLPAGLGIASYTIKAVYSGGPDLTGSTDASHFLIIKAANVFTTAQAASAVYSLSSQTVALKATVVDQSNPADIVSTGSVKFTIMAGNAILGSVVGGVVNNAATASYTVPAGLAAGGYAIIVSYSDTPSNFADGGDQNAILTIANSAATTSAANISIGYRPGAQNVTLSAAVTSTAGTVEEGTVTFTLMQGSTVIGKPTISGTVNDDEASAVYALPAATAAGNYTIDVQYIDNGGNFADGGDSSGTLTVKPAPVTTTAFNATTAFSPNSQTVTLQAALADNAFPSDPINEGDVTFTILNGKTQVGSVQGAVNGVSTGGGAASAVFDVPKGLAAGSYTIEVSYGDTPSNFIDNGDTNSTLTITPANVTVTASNASTFYSPNAQTLTFNATLADTSNSKDAVDEGVVVFTIMNGSNIIGNGRGAVSGNSVSANFDWSAGRAPPGNYTIAVSYIDSNGNFVDSGDTNGILNVAPAAVTVTANNASIAVPQSQTVTLSATIADDSFPTDTVDEGVVTFTIESGGAPVATPVQGTVSGGIASADFTVPAGLAAGSYTIAVAYSDKSGNYKDAGNDNSASLTFLLLPAVTTNPTNQTVSAGATVLFTAAASANPPATVQWQVSSDGGNTFSNIAGATSATLSLSNILPSQNGYEYQAVFTNELGSATTSAAILGVLSAPAVATNPNNQSVAVGGSATFTAVGNGNPPPAVQWQVSTDQGGTWTNINGATSTTLALSNIQASQNGTEYHAVFSNSGGKATTNAAVLVVQTPPTVTANPNNQNILAGQTAVFSATATGTPTPSVQWQVSSDNGATWINLIGANAATLTLSNVPSSLNGDLYRAVFSNSLGTFTTSAAVLSVQASPVITSATGAVFTIGQSVNFTVQATGTPPPTFALFGSLPSGISFIDNGNGTASLGGAAAAGAQGTYYFTIAASNGIGNGSTQSFTLRVNAAPPQPSPPPSPPTPPPQVVTLNIPPLLAFFDAFMQTVETTNADGSETLTSSFFGTPWIVATFDSFGNFVGASLLGFAFPNWIWYL